MRLCHLVFTTHRQTRRPRQNDGLENGFSEPHPHLDDHGLGYAVTAVPFPFRTPRPRNAFRNAFRSHPICRSAQLSAPLRVRFGALRADARPFAVDHAARRGRFAPRAYPTARRDGETRVPRRYGRCEDAPRRDAFFRGSSVEFTKTFPISVKFRKFGIDDRSYRDYMKLAEFGKLANFTRTFANLSDAKFSESSR